MAKVVEIATQFQNLFAIDSVPAELVNIVTGQVRESLNSFLDKGKRQNQ